MNAALQLSPPADPYLERKANAAKGIWGRVREVESGCWEWQGYVNPKGYGRTSFKERDYLIHRLVTEIFNGPLNRFESACHSCNNPRCVNPKHLVIGNAIDNTHDAIEARRQRRPRKLSEDQCLAAFERHEQGEIIKTLASEMGVTVRSLAYRLRVIRKLRAAAPRQPEAQNA